jgi:excinuclease UvrABC ATPase subunit
MPAAPHDTIRIRGAREHNLEGIDIDVPRRALTVFTGVSGSGKTSLVFDTIAAEAQRQLNETFTGFVRNRLPSYGRPEIDEISNLSPVVVIDQRRLDGNARSTVGTATDIHPHLRLLFSRAGDPLIGETNRFSFNDPTGMCPRCSGLGVVVSPQPESFVEEARSLAERAIALPGFGPGKYWYRQLLAEHDFDPDSPVGDWPAAKLKELHAALLENFIRIYVNTGSEPSRQKQRTLARFSTRARCPECDGGRLNEEARSVRLAGRTIVECAELEVVELARWAESLDVGPVAPVAVAVAERLGALADIGLGYLTLARETRSLSGGESQRIKLVRHLNSSLTEMIYVFDEPSIGLHPHDVGRLTELLRRLRDKGNTILVVEHDPDLIAIADHVIDLGPGAGAEGGTVVFEGTPAALAEAETSTARALRERLRLKTELREPTGALAVRGAERNNLQGVDVDFPTGVLTVVTGVAGSGKSSLVAELLDHHPGVIVDQSPIAGNRRSNTMTYTGVADPIRRRFAAANGVGVSLFSSNSDGACPECKGLGVVYTDLAFMEGYTSSCERCGGRRFTEGVLEYRLDGRSIADVYELTVEEAREAFASEEKIAPVLEGVAKVGLGYLRLGQPLSSVSGGEGQRLKLAAELASGRGGLHLIDEPTTGLHLADIDCLLGTLDGLVDSGGTVVVIEHALDVVRRADWVIDMGPGAGQGGGQVLFTGPPPRLVEDPDSLTAKHLRLDLATG